VESRRMDASLAWSKRLLSLPYIDIFTTILFKLVFEKKIVKVRTSEILTLLSRSRIIIIKPAPTVFSYGKNVLNEKIGRRRDVAKGGIE